MIVMATQTASTPSPSAVPHSRAGHPGMRRSVRPPWLPPTAVETTGTSVLYVFCFNSFLRHQLPMFGSLGRVDLLRLDVSVRKSWVLLAPLMD